MVTWVEGNSFGLGNIDLAPYVFPLLEVRACVSLGCLAAHWHRRRGMKGGEARATRSEDASESRPKSTRRSWTRTGEILPRFKFRAPGRTGPASQGTPPDSAKTWPPRGGHGPAPVARDDSEPTTRGRAGSGGGGRAGAAVTDV